MDNRLSDEKDTSVSGVRAIELLYRSIKEVTSNDTVFFQSQMRLNAPSMGVLSPARYMAVLEKSPKNLKIFELAFRQLLEAVNKFSERGVQFDWISIYMPVKYLKKSDCVKTITDMCRSALVRNERICFEIPPSVYDEFDETALETMKELRSLDFKFMITGIGGNAPVLRMGKFPVDYYMLHPMAVNTDPENERDSACLKTLVALINQLDSDAIACDITEHSQIKMLAEAECVYYTGDVSGTFMAERYMRSRGGSSDENNNENDNDNP